MNFFEALKESQKNVAPKLEEALAAGPLKKDFIFFCGFPKSVEKVSQMTFGFSSYPPKVDMPITIANRVDSDPGVYRRSALDPVFSWIWIWIRVNSTRIRHHAIIYPDDVSIDFNIEQMCVLGRIRSDPDSGFFRGSDPDPLFFKAGSATRITNT